MADQKISQLSDGGASQAADEYVVARSGANYRIDGASVAAAATSVGTLTSLTVSGNMTVDTNTLFVDAANNRVGVGTASPSEPLHIVNDSAATNSAVNLLTLTATSSGTPASGLGPGIRFQSERPDGSILNRAAIYGVSGTDASDDGDMAFYTLTSTAGGGFNEKMRLDASGNLGLGVTPSAWDSGEKALQIPNSGVFGWTGQDGRILANAYINGSVFKYIGNGYATAYVQSQGAHLWRTAGNNTSGAGASLSFTTAMTLDASGNLLMGQAASFIGTNTADGADSSSLTISGGGGASSLRGAYVGMNGNESASPGNIEIASGNVAGSSLALVGRSTTSPILFYAGGITERARITSTGAVLVNSTTTGGKLYVYNSATNFETNTIKAHDANASTTSDGVLVAIAERNTTNNTFYALGYYNTGAAAFKFRVADSGDVTNTNGSYTAISDAKLKQDIIDAPSQWDDIKAVRFRKYRFKADVAENPDAPYLLGVVAQELEQTSPGCIDEHPDYEEQEVTDEDGNVTTERVKVGVTKSFKQSVLLMKAAVALQEAMARIEALEARLEALEA